MEVKLLLAVHQAIHPGTKFRGQITPAGNPIWYSKQREKNSPKTILSTDILHKIKISVPFRKIQISLKSQHHKPHPKPVPFSPTSKHPLWAPVTTQKLCYYHITPPTSLQDSAWWNDTPHPIHRWNNTPHLINLDSIHMSGSAGKALQRWQQPSSVFP